MWIWSVLSTCWRGEVMQKAWHSFRWLTADCEAAAFGNRESICSAHRDTNRHPPYICIRHVFTGEITFRLHLCKSGCTYRCGNSVIRFTSRPFRFIRSASYSFLTVYSRDICDYGIVVIDDGWKRECKKKATTCLLILKSSKYSKLL